MFVFRIIISNNLDRSDLFEDLVFASLYHRAAALSKRLILIIGLFECILILILLLRHNFEV